MEGEGKVTGRGERKSVLQGVSMLVLSLLLTGCVASLIYIALSNQTCVTKPSADKEYIEADIYVESENQKKGERISYDKEGKVAYYYGDDGSFEVDDFGKGLHIVRVPLNQVCYIIPVGSNEGFRELEFENYLHNVNHSLIQVNRTTGVKLEPVTGQIEDVSFIPEGAHSECTYGYQWMTISTDNSPSRKKRQTPSAECTYCMLLLIARDGERYGSEVCIGLGFTGISTCPDLYKEEDRDEAIQKFIEDNS